MAPSGPVRQWYRSYASHFGRVARSDIELAVGFAMNPKKALMHEEDAYEFARLAAHFGRRALWGAPLLVSPTRLGSADAGS